MADDIPAQHDPPPSLPPTARGPNAAELTPPVQGGKPPSSKRAPTGGIDAAAGTGDLGFKFTPSVPTQDLSSDKLLATAPRVALNDKAVPALGGIPLIAKLGEGGMGAVYYGFHPRLKAEVAVKVLPFNLAEQDSGAVERFFREAQIAARVQSPHLIGVRDVNEENGLFYLVMEFVAGKSAGAHLKQTRQSGQTGLPEAGALDICIAAAAGLAAAHAEGIVHRDIKPDNIMLPKTKGSEGLNFKAAKLADLGLARTEELGSLTGTNAFMGTLGYMAPEQTQDPRHAGKPADVFSLGATLYALLAGQAPFTGTALLPILRDTLEKPHAPIRALRRDVSSATGELLDRCLAKDPVARFVDGTALLEALKVCREAVNQPERTQIEAIEQLTLLQKSAEVGAKAGMDGAEAARLAEEKRRQEEAGRIAEQKRKEEEAAAAKKIEDEKRAKETEAARLTDEKRKADLIHQSFASAVNAAIEAKKEKDWRQIVDLLDEQRKLSANSDHPSRKICDLLLAQAKAELKKQADFAEKLKEGQDYLKADLFVEAKQCFEDGRRLWPEAPRINEVTAGLDAAQRGIVEIERKRAEAAAKAEAERKARELEAQYQTAMADARQDLKGERIDADGRYVNLSETRRQRVEDALGRALQLKPGDAVATVLKEKLGLPKEISLDLGGGVKLEMVLIPAGKFLMGSPANEKGRYVLEAPQHEVTISQPFYMAKYETTQEQYEQIIGSNPSLFKGAKNPVEQVSWDDAREFCLKLGAKVGKRVELPTEAQWEYACRAGTTTSFNFGDTIRTDQANYNGNDTYGSGVKGVYRQKTTPAGTFAPNRWGLYDMHGNVLEWCSDWYDKDYYASSSKSDPPGAGSGAGRVVRGGSWFYNPRYCRSAYRLRLTPDTRGSSLGFRVIFPAGLH